MQNSQPLLDVPKLLRRSSPVADFQIGPPLAAWVCSQYSAATITRLDEPWMKTLLWLTPM